MGQRLARVEGLEFQLEFQFQFPYAFRVMSHILAGAPIITLI